MRRREFCSEASADASEPLGATASRVDRWILVEYRGVWAHDALEGSALSGDVKAPLRAARDARPHTKLLFVRRTERRAQPLRVFVAASPEHGGSIRGLELERHEDVLEHDLGGEAGDPVDHPLLLVCTHGKHDKCCARYGRPLYEAVADLVEPEWVWQASHVGGDRFAGNLVALPQGAYFGRVGRADVWPLVDAYLGGRVRLENYRGRSCHSMVVQAAERLLREELGLLGLEDVSFVSLSREADDRWLVEMRAGRTAETHAVSVALTWGPLAHLTCSSETLRRPRRYAATGRELSVRDA